MKATLGEGGRERGREEGREKRKQERTERSQKYEACPASTLIFILSFLYFQNLLQGALHLKIGGKKAHNKCC